MKRFQKVLREKGVDCALLFNTERKNSNVIYLSNYEGYGCLVMPQKGKGFLYAPDMEVARAEEAAKKVGLGVRVARDNLFKMIKPRAIGLDFDSVSMNEFSELKKRFECKIVDIGDELKKLRSIKNDEEVESIKRACKFGDRIFEDFASRFKRFRDEREAARYLEDDVRAKGLGVAFDTIVASGLNAAVPHHVPMGKIRKGFCIVDFGVRYKGYNSDVTRMLYVGKPSARERKIYDDFLGLQEKAIDMVRDGAKAKDVDLLVRNKLGKRFVHSLGHGIGIEVHEAPIISERSKDILKRGMAITIEPGVYVSKKYGLRIEDDVLVEGKRGRVLSKAGKELRVV